MADEKTDSGSSTATEEERYSAEELVARAHDLVGAPAHVVAGALYSTERKTHTTTQAKAAVRSFRKHKVEVDGASAEEE